MNIAVLVLFLSALVGVCAYAWFRGRSAERYGAALYFVAFLVAVAAQTTLGLEKSVVPMLLLDTMAALGFLVLAFRYNSLWLGVVMILQGLVLGLHTTHLTDLEDPQIFGMNLYAVLVNLVSLGILATFALATTVSRRERRMEAQAKASTHVPAVAELRDTSPGAPFAA